MMSFIGKEMVDLCRAIQLLCDLLLPIGDAQSTLASPIKACIVCIARDLQRIAVVINRPRKCTSSPGSLVMASK